MLAIFISLQLCRSGFFALEAGHTKIVSRVSETHGPTRFTRQKVANILYSYLKLSNAPMPPKHPSNLSFSQKVLQLYVPRHHGLLRSCKHNRRKGVAYQVLSDDDVVILAIMNDTEHLMGDEPPLMVRVKAPATLPAGYTFQALLNDDPDRPFICEVVSVLLAWLLFCLSMFPCILHLQVSNLWTSFLDDCSPRAVLWRGKHF